MCKWQQSDSGPDQYFTLGIERTTKFLIHRPGEERGGKQESIADLTGKTGKSETDVNQPEDSNTEPVPGGGAINNTQVTRESSESFGNDSTESFSDDTSSESLGNSSEEGNNTYSEGLSSSEEQGDFVLPVDSQNKNSSILSEIFQSIYTRHDNSELQDNITAKYQTHVEKRSVDQKYSPWFTNFLRLKENLHKKSNNREKRDTPEIRLTENSAEEAEDSESEESGEDEEDEYDEEENMTSEELNLIIKLRGIR